MTTGTFSNPPPQIRAPDCPGPRPDHCSSRMPVWSIVGACAIIAPVGYRGNACAGFARPTGLPSGGVGMDERAYQGPRDDDLSELTGRRFRRGRRHTPPGEPSPRFRCRQRRRSSDWHTVQIGDVVADLTPRQAVVWLMNLDTMVAL